MDFRLLVVLVGWLAGWWLLWRPARLDAIAAPPTEPGPSQLDRRGGPTVAVVVPARNEAGTLPGLLASLGRQHRLPDEVVVVDDQSTDATAAIASAAGVTVCAGEALPTGWTGKAWACHQGARQVSADVIVFVDADVELEPDGLALTVGQLHARGGLVSVLPYHRVVRWYERCSALFNVVSMMGVGAASPGRRGRARGAFGPVLACRRDDYAAAGGHEAVRTAIADDIALARRFRRLDRPVTALTGGSAARFRMYPGGPGQLIEGWSKNFATGASSVALPRLALIGLWLTTMLITVQGLLEWALSPVTGHDLSVATVAIGAVAFAAQLFWMQRQLGNFGVGTAVAYPVLAIVFLAVFARSAYLTVVRRRVTWRGRSVALVGDRPEAPDVGAVGP